MVLYKDKDGNESEIAGNYVSDDVKNEIINEAVSETKSFMSNTTIIWGSTRTISASTGTSWYGVSAPTIPDGKIVLRYIARVVSGGNNYRVAPSYYNDTGVPDSVILSSDGSGSVSVALGAVVIGE